MANAGLVLLVFVWYLAKYIQALNIYVKSQVPSAKPYQHFSPFHHEFLIENKRRTDIILSLSAK